MAANGPLSPAGTPRIVLVAWRGPSSWRPEATPSPPSRLGQSAGGCRSRRTWRVLE
ncbi:hypothetical protein CHLRE_11g467534v5 [Chlamydomonas reinhardtii]|uniref:Uncharacterized protein n=1 Tax=Chlamydomonas reinhardtii TaxID=3055 RepID=A0A2K3D773_CHLRE|nr:uncharacterized protein CHLRE_11g467534v5 [Chlamydomonas reinhardtii]PNW76378.1 hypothetical protein CHLRE_11g467534v5 [Chlamydomonas reinhardtii]